jgi:hypothetical protein
MFKLLKWVSVFLMMTSGVSYAMETSSSDDIDFKKSVLRQAIDFCKQSIDFETDMIEFYQEDKRLKSEQIVGNNHSSFSYDEEIARISGNISLITQFKLELEDETQFNAETFLSKLFDARFFFLVCRYDIIREVRSLVRENMDNLKQGKKMGGGTYGPTKPEFFEKLTPYMQILARNSTDRYQTINRLIVLMWKLVDPRMLNDKNKLKVRASTTLWDNLMGKRDYLGHPDEALIVYEDGSDLPTVTLYGTDMELYGNHIRKQKITIDLLGWAKGKKMNMMSTPYEVSLWDESKSFYNKIPEAPYPDWLKPYPKLEITPTKAPPLETLQKTKKLTGPSLAKKKKKKKTMSSFPTPKLPMGGEEKPLETILPLMKEEEEKTELVPTVEAIPPTIMEEESDEDGVEVDELNNNNSAFFDNTSKSFNVRPAGMRQFRSQAPQNNDIKEENKITLKGTHLSTRDEIFNPKQFQNVSFGQFKSLWKHISGEKSVIESTGSSHKKLIGPSGEVFGTFAHGDNMTYGPRTIKYIRDALIQIGYGSFPER